MPFVVGGVAVGAYEMVMGGGAIIGGYMTAHAANNIANSIQQNQSTTPPPSTGSSDGTASEGDQHQAAGQAVNSTSPQTPPGQQCKDCGPNNNNKDHKFRDQSKKDDHFDRHGQDFGGPQNPDTYEQKGSDFMNSNNPDIQQTTRANGDVVRYNPQTNEFGITAQDGTLKTYYSPDTAVHGYPSNLDYFHAQ